MTEFERIVIVGAGVAGLRAAERLRELDYDGELVIIGDEPRWPYHRPLVSKDLLAGTDRPADLTLQRHVDTGARWRLGTRAERLETQRKVVTLPGGEEIKYDGLIIATGVEPKHLKGVPRHSPRVHTLRTVDEAMAVKRTIHESDLPIVVLGTGYIGCDVAASARKMGREVVMVGRSRFPLKALGNDVAASIDKLHRKHRVRMAMGTDIRNWVTADDSLAMHTTDGQLLVAGTVVLAIGSQPAVEWMRGSGLVLEDGVLCDATLFAAGAENVVVAGDCGRWPNLRFDDVPRRVEHWINAVEMGRAAAENLLVGREKATPFTPIPRVWSGQYGMRLQIAGVPSLGKDTVHLSDGVPGTPGVTGYVRNGKLVGVCGWDTPRAMIKWTQELHNLLPVPEQSKRAVAPSPAKAMPAGARPPAPPVRQTAGAPTAPVAQQSMPLPVPAMAGAPSANEMTMVQPGAMARAMGAPTMAQPPIPAMASLSMARPPAPAVPPAAGPPNRQTSGPRPQRPPMPTGRDLSIPPGPVNRDRSIFTGRDISAPAAASSSGRHAKPTGPAGRPPVRQSAPPPARPPMPSMPMARPPMHSMPMARPDLEPMTAPVPVVRDEPMLPETASIPIMSAPNLSLSNLAVPNIVVPDTPAAAMRPAPPPARQRRGAESSQAMPPVPPPNQHPSFPNMRPVPPPSERYQEHPSFPNMRAVPPPSSQRYQEHPSFPNMRAVPPPSERYQEHPSFPNMRPVARPDRENVRLPAGEAVRGFG
jgi:NADPH-dependent 2,4-dienoyl-CoA reductase/sulfur reductase-like enzyme